MNKVGILCHGRHTGTKDWEGVVWGRGGLMGQIPKALQMVLLYNQKPFEVVALIFGSGDSKRGGIIGGQVMVNYMFDNLPRLVEFPAFGNLTARDFADLRNFLEKITMVETTAKNTVQDFETAMAMLHQRDVDLAVSVTCATHAPRCMRDAISVCGKIGGNAPRYGITVVSAETHYADATVDDIGILEPVHRGDTPESFTRFHRAMLDMMALFRGGDTAKRESLLSGIATVLEKNK